LLIVVNEASNCSLKPVELSLKRCRIIEISRSRRLTGVGRPPLSLSLNLA
jgi:hypothetical protein